MQALPLSSAFTPLRLVPGDDVRVALQHALRDAGLQAAFVVQGMGSLSVAQLRYAGAQDATALHGDLEILTLAGSLSPDGPHLHISVANARGEVFGGHVAPGCIVRTTAEILVALLPEHYFSREIDPRTGFAELVVRHARHDE
ncbi:DNA-binding protein [Paraburkholderia sp. A1RI_3L]|uniref:PPC domain-containing DNA-binding protein n=1 Tax=Paraburkholderia TaxID=1822464 RepID=UPI003B78D8D7